MRLFACLVLFCSPFVWAQTLDSTIRLDGVVIQGDADSDCLEWAYEPLVDFIHPSFEQAMGRPIATEAKKEEGTGSLYNDIELLDAAAAKSNQALDDFHGPPFQKDAVWKQPQKQMPDEFHAPAFHQQPIGQQQQWAFPDEFHAPEFQQVSTTQRPTVTVASSIPDNVQMLDAVTSYDSSMPEEFHAPPFQQEPAWSSPQPRQWELPESFHAPAFEQESEWSPPQQDWESPEEFHAPPFEQQQPSEQPEQYGLPDQFHEPGFKEELMAQHPIVASKQYAEPVPLRHDTFAQQEGQVYVSDADVPSHTADVYDEFSAIERERPASRKRIRKPTVYKKEEERREYYPTKPVKSHSPRVRDGFSDGRKEKTRVEPAYLPKPAAEVHDQFVKVEKKPKVVEKNYEKYEEDESAKSKHWYTDAGPVTQFFLDLVGADAPVHDSFSHGVNEKTIVEPIRKLPAPKADVHDEFTTGSKGDGYRVKRTVGASASSDDQPMWKLVCVKRRQVQKLIPKPLPRVLTSGDFVEYAQQTKDHISRCIGRQEGESVAAGLCKKHFLRCSPSISVLMCSQLNEVFSEVRKMCVSQLELNECTLARTIDVHHQIKFTSPKKEEQPQEEFLDMASGDVNKFCVGKKDGFYHDKLNCSRALQCFDDDLFEYPPCTEPQVFDIKRELCVAQNSTTCSN